MESVAGVIDTGQARAMHIRVLSFPSYGTHIPFYLG